MIANNNMQRENLRASCISIISIFGQTFGARIWRLDSLMLDRAMKMVAIGSPLEAGLLAATICNHFHSSPVSSSGRRRREGERERFDRREREKQREQQQQQHER